MIQTVHQKEVEEDKHPRRTVRKNLIIHHAPPLPLKHHHVLTDKFIKMDVLVHVFVLKARIRWVTIAFLHVLQTHIVKRTEHASEQ
jgi:hypothetical protein